jgi:hypothetical protein
MSVFKVPKQLLVHGVCAPVHRRRLLPPLALRAILDGAIQELPPFVHSAMSAQQASRSTSFPRRIHMTVIKDVLMWKHILATICVIVYVGAVCHAPVGGLGLVFYSLDRNC